MLERLISAVIITAALAGTPSCATIGPVQEQTLESSFYTEKKVLEEQKGETSILYKYKNGIEAEVTYKKSEGLSDIYINILADPNNVLVQGTIVTETPDNPSYQIMVDGKKIKKAISFRMNTNRTVSILLADGRLEYVKVSERVNGKDKIRHYQVPELLVPIGMAQVKRIEEYLDLEAHQRILGSVPTSSKTQSF